MKHLLFGHLLLKVKKEYDDEEEEDFKPAKKSKKDKVKVKPEPVSTPQKGGKKVKKEENQEVS